MTTATEKRLVARASASVQERIARAAELSGSTLSQFLIDAALKEADLVTEKATQLEVSVNGFKTIMAALDAPPRALPRLERAAQRYRTLINATKPGSDQQKSQQKEV